MNYLLQTSTACLKQFKLPKDNEWQFNSATEWQFNYFLRVKTSPTCVTSSGIKYWCKNGSVVSVSYSSLNLKRMLSMYDETLTEL